MVQKLVVLLVALLATTSCSASDGVSTTTPRPGDLGATPETESSEGSENPTAAASDEPDDRNGETESGAETTALLDEDSVLFVTGRIDLESGDVSLSGTTRIRSDQDLTPPPGDWSIVIEDLSGSELVRMPFDPIETLDAQSRRARFNIPVQPAPGVAIGRIRIFNRDDQAGEFAGNGSLPMVDVLSPVAGEALPLSAPQAAWRGIDDDGAELKYSLFVSLDGGETFKPGNLDTNVSEVVLHPSLVGPTDQAVLMISVSDGINATYVESEPFSIVAE